MRLRRPSVHVLAISKRSCASGGQDDGGGGCGSYRCSRGRAGQKGPARAPAGPWAPRSSGAAEHIRSAGRISASAVQAQRRRQAPISLGDSDRVPTTGTVAPSGWSLAEQVRWGAKCSRRARTRCTDTRADMATRARPPSGMPGRTQRGNHVLPCVVQWGHAPIVRAANRRCVDRDLLSLRQCTWYRGDSCKVLARFSRGRGQWSHPLLRSSSWTPGPVVHSTMIWFAPACALRTPSWRSDPPGSPSLALWSSPHPLSIRCSNCATLSVTVHCYIHGGLVTNKLAFSRRRIRAVASRQDPTRMVL